jgi:hypothetical protein
MVKLPSYDTLIPVYDDWDNWEFLKKVSCVSKIIVGVLSRLIPLVPEYERERFTQDAEDCMKLVFVDIQHSTTIKVVMNRLSDITRNSRDIAGYDVTSDIYDIWVNATK